MAWEWSHTQEAYDNFANNVRKLDRDTLQVLYAEWHAFDENETADFNSEKYKEARNTASRLPTDILARFVIEKATEQALCDNGGFNAWACPYGCPSHLVSFDPQ